jgi:hypothetical protein
VGNDAERFRQRARDCRAIAIRLPDGAWRTELMALAADLDREAEEIEAEEETKDGPRPEPRRE